MSNKSINIYQLCILTDKYEFSYMRNTHQNGIQKAVFPLLLFPLFTQN